MSAEHRERLGRRFDDELQHDVVLSVARHAGGCEACDRQITIAEEICALSPRLRLEAHEAGHPLLPETRIVRPDRARHLRFHGLPSGHEFPPFLDAIVSCSRDASDLPAATVRTLLRLDDDVLLKVFTTPT